jgi:hypothetical protein
LIHFGKALEAAARGLRPFVVPSYRHAFNELAALGMREHRPGEPVVCCDFADARIDSVGGRYYYSLVRDLIDAGYFPVFTEHRNTLSTFGTSRMKSLLLNQRLGTVPALEALKEPYFLITDRKISPSAQVERTVVVNYEKRLCQGPDEIAFPVFVHPQLEGLPFQYRVETVRPARLFFGGNTEEGKYDKNVIRDEYHMLTRREMLAVADEVTPAFRPADAASWLASNDLNSYVLCETQHCKIPRDRWLVALGKADFFLACPGVGMPLCHNLIEAMAAGAVPILQYAAYLPEPLTDRVNCMAFHDEASLRKTLDEIQNLPPARILELRSNVRDYYDEILAPGRFAKRLFTGSTPKTLLLNAYRVPRP